MLNGARMKNGRLLGRAWPERKPPRLSWAVQPLRRAARRCPWRRIACNELPEKQTRRLACFLRRRNRYLERAGVFAHLKGRKAATFLLFVHHRAHARGGIGPIGKLQNQIVQESCRTKSCRSAWLNASRARSWIAEGPSLSWRSVSVQAIGFGSVFITCLDTVYANLS
jgi:hypothetical protein